MSDSLDTDQTRFPRSGAWRAVAVVSAFLAAISSYLILSGNNSGRAAFDATAYHLRFIRTLTDQLPALDLSNPLTATTPGYHILMACISRLGIESSSGLRLVSALIGCGFVGLVAWWCARRVGALAGTLLVLPLASSLYVVGSAAWTAPDNLSWLLVAAIFFLSLAESNRKRPLLVACALLVILVTVRQNQVWAAAMIWVAAWIRAREAGHSALRAAVRTVPWILATVPAFAVLAWFMREWGGLTAPRFQTEVQAFNLATPSFMLLEVALLSIGFIPWIASPICRAWKSHPRVLASCALLGIALAAVPVTTASFEAGRFSGWWVLIERAPVIGGRTSVLLLLAAPVGASIIASLLLALGPRERTIIGVALLAFMAALTANFYCWQRYHEPWFLVVLPVLAVLGSGARKVTVRDALSPLLLAALLGVVTVLGVRGDRVADDALPAPHHWAPGDDFAKGVVNQR